ncbi:hypothetical protein NYE25_08300 [Paenibacillus sp. FSL E2-8871]|jgi:pyridoxine 5'-phosphate synthase PdxJ|uniref:Uncharacterized protein n=1 Tax=Paenibacillus odorifer TaxID=189426 RepID=A0A1R0ZAX0_9BACL|nr:hypothetical protein [Paenibacillus odorifer]OME65752.1 hypothetical protein BSK65_23470 [Paenibacillus odorifer]
MWIWSLVTQSGSLDFEEQYQLNEYIKTLSDDELKASRVYDPDRRSIDAFVYAQMKKLLN